MNESQVNSNNSSPELLTPKYGKRLEAFMKMKGNSRFKVGSTADDQNRTIQLTNRDVIVNSLSDGSLPIFLQEYSTADVHESGKLHQKKVLLVESKSSEDSSTMDCGLLPGDQLISVDGTSVEHFSATEASDIVTNALTKNNFVKLTVRPMSELTELSVRSDSNGQAVMVSEHIASTHSLKRTASRRHVPPSSEAGESCDDDVEQKVWLKDETGYSMVIKLSQTDGENVADWRCTVKEVNSGAVREANAQNIFQANPARLNRVEDLTLLQHLNEPSILQTLRTRYCRNLIHTFAGKRTLVIIKPWQSLNRSIYSEKVMDMFYDCKPEDMPPHIFAVAQSAFDALKSTRSNQTVLLLGRSNSGKTTNTQHIVRYLLHRRVTSPSFAKKFSEGRVTSVFVLLEAFFECRTLLNTSATRCVHKFKFNYDTNSTNLLGMCIELLAVDRMRFIHRPDTETSYNVFYQMLAGIEPTLRKELFLDKLSEPNLLMTPYHNVEDQEEASNMWNRVVDAMLLLDFTRQETTALCTMLAAIYHFGVAGVTRDTDGRVYRFARPAAAARAASLLGTDVKTLSSVVFPCVPAVNATGVDQMEAFVSSLYQHVVLAIVSLINRSFTEVFDDNVQLMSISVLDLPGIQNPATCGRTTGASLDDLCQNYVHERLQQFCYNTLVTATVKCYADESVDCDRKEIEALLAKEQLFNMAEFLDSQSRSPVRVNNSSKLRVSHAGLLSQLDSAISQNVKNSECFDLFSQQLVDNKKYEGIVEYTTAKNSCGLLKLGHLQSSNQVQYNVDGWTHMANSLTIPDQLFNVLCSSSSENISMLYQWMTSTGCNEILIKHCQPFGVQLKIIGDKLIETAKQTNVHFVHCFLPCHVTDFPDDDPDFDMSMVDNKTMLSTAVLLSQLRGAQILITTQLQKLGFPCHMPYKYFLRHFNNLWPDHLRPTHPVSDVKKATEQLLKALNVSPNDYKLGRTQVFLRPGALALLEENQDIRTNEWVVKLQAMLRGCASRRRLSRKKLDIEAIECIQFNVRTMWSVRRWSWWKLFANLRPLLDCNHRQFVGDESSKMSSPSGSDRRHRKLQAEVARLNELARADRARRDKLAREKQQVEGEKLMTERQLKAVREDFQAETDRMKNLEKRLNDLSMSPSSTDVTNSSLVKELRQRNAELERKHDELESRLEQQMDVIAELEQAKYRLESANSKTHQQKVREQQDKEFEIDELKATYKAKMLSIEEQLEEELTDKQKLQAEKRELEKKLRNLEQNGLLGGSDAIRKLKQKLKKSKVVISDSKAACQQYQKSSSIASRHAKEYQNELEDAMTLNSAANRTKKGLESELENLQEQLDSHFRIKQEAEDRSKRLALENAELHTRLAEVRDETDDLMKKYKALVQQNSIDLSSLQQQSFQIQDLQSRVSKYKMDIETLQMRLQFMQDTSITKQAAGVLEAKIRELESRVAMETTCRNRSEKLLARARARQAANASEQRQVCESLDSCRAELKQLMQQIHELKTQLTGVQIHDTETSIRNTQLEKRLRSSEAKSIELSEDLELASRRIKELQRALNSCTPTRRQHLQLEYGTDSADDNDDIDNEINVDEVESNFDASPDLRRHNHVVRQNSSSSSSSVTSVVQQPVDQLTRGRSYLDTASISSSSKVSSPSLRRTVLHDSQI